MDLAIRHCLVLLGNIQTLGHSKMVVKLGVATDSRTQATGSVSLRFIFVDHQKISTNEYWCVYFVVKCLNDWICMDLHPFDYNHSRDLKHTKQLIPELMPGLPIRILSIFVGFIDPYWTLLNHSKPWHPLVPTIVREKRPRISRVSGLRVLRVRMQLSSWHCAEDT